MKLNGPRIKTAALAVSAALMLSACATIGPPQPPSLELPKPITDLRATRKGDHVTLTWTVPTVTTDRRKVQSAGPTRICRRTEPVLTECGTPIGEALPSPPTPATSGSKKKASAAYTDSLVGQIQMVKMQPGASGFMTYAIESLNAAGRTAGLSNQVRVSLMATLPPPQNFAAQVTAQGVVLTWTPDVPPSNAASAKYVYRVYRREEGSQQSNLVGETALGNGAPGSVTDSVIVWEKTYEYRAETVTMLSPEKTMPPNSPETQIEGDDTPEIKVFTHDVFPPTVPTGLQAAASGPGQKTFIDLVWAPGTDADLDGYNVYRHHGSAAPERINTALVKSPAYRDEAVAPGNQYSYSVSAVDVRGNESARSDEAGEAVP